MERGNTEFDADYGETGVLMMRMKKTMFGTGGAMVKNSGFCVLKGLVGVLSHGVYGTTVTKKKYIVPSTSRDIPLSHSSKTRRLGVFMLFVVICMGTSTRYSV